VDHVPLEIRVEVGRIAEYLEKAADTVLRLVLRLLLNVYRRVRLVQMAQQPVQQLQQLERWLVVEFNQAQVAHEGRPVQGIHDLLYLSRVF
jgi:hypothetical protein